MEFRFDKIEQFISGKDSEKVFLEHIEGNNWSSYKTFKIGVKQMDPDLSRWRKIWL